MEYSQSNPCFQNEDNINTTRLWGLQALEKSVTVVTEGKEVEQMNPCSCVWMHTFTTMTVNVQPCRVKADEARVS